MRRRKAAVETVERKRCAIYTRKSTTHGLEKEFSSLDAQWEACAGYVRAQPGWELVEERYDDGGFTGANTARPAFQRLMADVVAGRIDVIVVYKIDRLSRSLLDFASLMERFREAGAFFVSVTQPFLSADSDAMAQLLLNILMAFAQFERQMIAERIRDKVVASRRKGLWTGGNVPFGYAVENRKLLPRQDEAAVVRAMAELYMEWQSDAAVARQLGARHCLNRRGRPWTPQGVGRVLSSAVYAGYVTLGSELHEGEHEAVITRERFDQLQALRAAMAAPAERAQGQRNPEYLLRGLLFCGCPSQSGEPCGFAMTPASTRKGRTVYRYYRCISRDKAGPDACSARPLPAKRLEELVREQVAGVARQLHGSRGAAGTSIDAELRSHTRRQLDEAKARRLALRQRLNELGAELRELDEQLAQAPSDANHYLERRREPRLAERKRCREELRAVEVRLGKLEGLVLDGAWIAEQLRTFERVWEHLLPINRLQVIRAVVARVDVDEPSGEVAITLQPWVGERLETGGRRLEEGESGGRRLETGGRRLEEGRCDDVEAV